MPQKQTDFILYTDGACRGNPGPASIGILLREKNNKIVVSKFGKKIGKATNNIAEYSALIAGLKEARKAGQDAALCNIDVRIDSELIVKQINGVYRIKNVKLRPLYEEAKELLSFFSTWKIKHIPREENHEADKLANQALDIG